MASCGSLCSKLRHGPKDEDFKEWKDHLEALKKLGGKDTTQDAAPVWCPVWVRCTIANLYAIDVREQTFQALVKFEATWWPLTASDYETLNKLYEDHGETLKDKWVKETDTNRYKHAQKLYLQVGAEEETHRIHGPRFTFTNCIEEKPDSDWFTLEKWRPDHPVIKWNYIFVGTFQEHMELRWFPLDRQPLKILVSSGWDLAFSQDPKKAQDPNSVSKLRTEPQVWLRKNLELPSVVAHSRFVQRNQYRLAQRLEFKSVKSDHRESSMKVRYSRLLIEMVVYRKPWFWFYNVILPNFLIMLVMIASYAEDVSNFEGRCSITVTVLLALVAFRYVISDRTPEINYSTLVG